MSRRPLDLCTRLQSLYYKFDVKMHDAKIDYILTCTYRSDAEQNLLYAQGRTLPGRIVTNAKAGESKHNTVNADGLPAAQAFDIVIMKNGKPDWDVTNPDWKKAGMIGQSLGLEWAGDWKTFKEYPHFQLP